MDDSIESDEAHKDSIARRIPHANQLRIAGLAFMASFVSIISSFATNGLVSPPGNPGVERPVVPSDVFVYTFEAFAYVLAALAVTAVIVSVAAARQWLSSYLAIAFTWISVVFFSFITLGRQEQVELFQADRADLLMEGRLPGWEGLYSAGFLFFGVGIALFSWTLFRTRLTNRAVSIVGIVLGFLLGAGSYVRLVLGRDDVTDAFLTPFAFLMLWLFVLGIVIYRHSTRAVAIPDQPVRGRPEPLD